MKLKTVAKLITIPLFTMTMAYADNTDTFNPCGLEETVSYAHMSTKEIEFEVEKHSIKGDLPFELGLELLKRWSKA
jgi:hypothetical protein